MQNTTVSPTISLEGDANGAPHPDPSFYDKNLSGKCTYRLVTGGIGHNLPQEAPQAFAQAVIAVDGSIGAIRFSIHLGDRQRSVAVGWPRSYSTIYK